MTHAIVVEDLSKAYRIGLKEEVPDSLITAVVGMLKSPWRNFQKLRRMNTSQIGEDQSEDLHWALKNVSFEVAEGEVLGVIGRNGAGKSTLLKILSRITAPTTGSAKIQGRVSSLLEVGTGFHPELSGRENIYLNGTILGMTKREIDSKFDAIVDFSGVEKFLDTPIKRYSSGMKVRLAFSVAAHLEPEILIIDEVLAVGDAEFQRKCMGKMQDVAKGGRTVLFVSHNMPAVRTLTTQCLVLKNGKMLGQFDTDMGIEKYVEDCTSEAMLSHSLDYFRRDKGAEFEARFKSIKLNSGSSPGESNSLPAVQSGQTLNFVFEVLATRHILQACVSLTLIKNQEIVATTLYSPDYGSRFDFNEGVNVLSCTIDGLHLAPGQYSLTAGINKNANAKAYDVIQDFPLFEVDIDGFGDGKIDWPHRPWGAVYVRNACWEQL